MHCRTAQLQDSKTQGLQDFLNFAGLPEFCRTAGNQDSWKSGQQDSRKTGEQDSRTAGQQDSSVALKDFKLRTHKP